MRKLFFVIFVLFGIVLSFLNGGDGTTGEKIVELPALTKPSKIKITDEYKNKEIEEFKQGGFWKHELQQHKTKLTFPDYFPPYGWLTVNNGKIYAQTYKTKDNKSQFIVLDSKGNVLKEIYLPVQGLEGKRMQAVYNNKLYKIIENLEKECWELHIYNMKRLFP